MCYSSSSTERNVSMHMDTGSNLGFYQFEISPPPPYCCGRELEGWSNAKHTVFCQVVKMCQQNKLLW